MYLISLELILGNDTVYDTNFFLIQYEVVLSPFIKKSVLSSFICHDMSLIYQMSIQVWIYFRALFLVPLSVFQCRHQLYIVLIILTVWVMITCRLSPSTFFFKNTSPILGFYMHVNYVSILITLYVNKFVEFNKKSFMIWLRLHRLYIQIHGKLYPYEMELAGTMKGLKFYFSCKLSSSLDTISEMLV